MYYKRFIIGNGSYDYGGWWVSRPVDSKLETQERLVSCSPNAFRLESEGRASPCLSLRQSDRRKGPLTHRRVSFLFYSDLPGIDWVPPTLERAVFHTSLPIQMFISPKYPHRHTQSNGWPNVWAPCGPVKLTSQ